MATHRKILRLRLKQIRGNLHELLRILEDAGWSVEFV